MDDIQSSDWHEDQLNIIARDALRLPA